MEMDLLREEGVKRRLIKMNAAAKYAMCVDPLTIVTFQSLVDAIIPESAVFTGSCLENTPAASALHVHEYMIWELDHTLSLHFGLSLHVIPLAAATADLLNEGALQFIASRKVQRFLNRTVGGAPFAALSPFERIQTLGMLERLEVDLGKLPAPYKDDGGLVRFIVDYLNRGTMFGYYSEWSAYGTTRLDTPTERRLEYFPISWRQVRYPGVSLGYRAFLDYKLFINRNEGETSDV